VERELLLLGLLRGHEMHGYQLMEFIDTQMASCVDLKKPTAYFLLDKMTAAGWIRFEQSQEGNRPPRRVYGITTDGEAAFQRLLRENLAAYEPARFISDIGLAFVDALPAEEALVLLQHRQQIVEAQLTSAQAVPEHKGGAQLIIEHQRHHLVSELDWLKIVIKRVSAQVGGVKKEITSHRRKV
jgi:DNA-binding PadR family transcriptional regulator